MPQRRPNDSSLARPSDATRPREPLLEAGRVRLGLGVLLTAIAGYVDVVGYLHLEGLYLSFMSGNSMELGIGAASHDWVAAGALALLVASFVAGVLLGTVAAGMAGAWAVSAVLALEAALLAASVGLTVAGWRPTLAIAPAVAAMGVQNAALQPLGGVRLGATFITGTLVSIGQELGRALLGMSGPWAWGRHALVWAALVAGAAVGAVWHAPARLDAFLAPAALVAGLAVLCGAAAVIDRWRHHRMFAVAPQRAAFPSGASRRHPGLRSGLARAFDRPAVSPAAEPDQAAR